MNEGSRLAEVGWGRVQIAALASFSIAWDDLIKAITKFIFPTMPLLRKRVVVTSCGNASRLVAAILRHMPLQDGGHGASGLRGGFAKAASPATRLRRIILGSGQGKLCV